MSDFSMNVGTNPALPELVCPPTGRSAGAILLGLSALSVLVFLPDLGGRPVWQIDQVQRAEAAAEMLATGDWTVPRVGGAPYAFYPPLGYWTIVLPGRLFGMSDAVARLPSAVAGWLTVLAIFGIGSRLMDRARGAAAAAILALTPGFVHIGRIVAPDMLLVLGQTLALAFFLEWLDDRASGRRRRWPVPGLIAAAAVGILAKGPVAVAFPLAAGLAYLAFTRRLRVLREFPWVAVTLGTAILVLPWCVALAFRPEGPVFLDKFINENFRAPMGQDLHVNSPWYYLLRMPPRALPWVLLLPAALLDGSWTRRETRFGWCWLLPVLAVLSASASKRPTYFVFLFPPLALLLGDAAVRLCRGEASERARTAFRSVLALLAVTAVGFAGMLWLHPRPFLNQPWFGGRIPIAAAAGAVTIFAVDAARRRGFTFPLLTMGLATAAGLFVHAAWIERDADPEEVRAASFCRKVEEAVPPEKPLWTLAGLDPKFRYNIHRETAVWPQPYIPADEHRYVLATFNAPADAACLAGAEEIARETIEQDQLTRLLRTKPAGNLR